MVLFVALILFVSLYNNVCHGIEATPEGINSAVNQLTSSINDQTARISALDSDLYSLATKNEAAQLDSAIQNIDLVQQQLASSSDISNVQTQLNQQAVTVNAAYVASQTAKNTLSSSKNNEPDVIGMGNSALAQQQLRSGKLDALEEQKKKASEHLASSSSSLLNDYSDAADAIQEAVERADSILAALGDPEMDFEALFDSVTTSLPGYTASTNNVVYRWKYFNVMSWYSNGCSSCRYWLMGNNDDSYGGSGYFNPSDWGDSYPYAYEFQYDSNALFNVRSLVTEKSYGSSMTNAISHDERMNTVYSDQTGNYVMVFRIKNTKSTTITHNFRFYFTSYWSYQQAMSIALNGNNEYTYTGNCDQCFSTVAVSFPPDRVSTLMFISTSSYPTSYKRPTTLGFFENTLNLPQGLVYVDDLDSAPNSIA